MGIIILRDDHHLVTAPIVVVVIASNCTVRLPHDLQMKQNKTWEQVW
jgi:hypothetical protein